MTSRVNTYYPGTTVRLVATFRDLNLQLSDPSSVTFLVTDPTGITTTPVVVRDSLGAYHADVVTNTGPSQVGTWNYRVETTGTPTVALEGAFVMSATRFAS